MINASETEGHIYYIVFFGLNNLGKEKRYKLEPAPQFRNIYAKSWGI